MKQPVVALTLLFAPPLMLTYHHLGKLLLRLTEAGQYLNGGGGSIKTAKLDAYEANLILFAFLGLFSAVLLAIEVVRFFQRRHPNQVMQMGVGFTDTADETCR